MSETDHITLAAAQPIQLLAAIRNVAMAPRGPIGTVTSPKIIQLSGKSQYIVASKFLSVLAYSFVLLLIVGGWHGVLIHLIVLRRSWWVGIAWWSVASVLLHLDYDYLD